MVSGISVSPQGSPAPAGDPDALAGLSPPMSSAGLALPTLQLLGGGLSGTRHWECSADTLVTPSAGARLAAGGDIPQ